jgi:hypothetical protein
MGGTSPPTPTTPTLSSRAINLPRSETASASPPLMPLSSPSLLPFKLVHSDSMNSGGGFIPSFRYRVVLPPLRKRSRQKRRTCRVCWRHGPWAPNSQESHCGRRHWPRAPNQSTGLEPRGGAGNLFLVVSDSISPDSSFFGRQFSWLKFLLFVFHFWFFQLVVRWCMVFPLHLLSILSFGSLRPSSCFVHFHFGYAI